jgi:hypothetical protein
MAKLVIWITSRIDLAQEVAESWQKACAPGVTLIQGHGLRRVQEAANSIEILPGTLSLASILRESVNLETLLLLTVLEDDSGVQTLIDTTQAIVGDLHAPHAGVLFAIDVERALGIGQPTRPAH